METSRWASPRAIIFPTVLNRVTVTQRLNQQIPLNGEFQDESGKAVRMGDYFGKRPVVLALVYYDCPMLCSEELDGLVGALDMVKFTPGKDFDVVVASIDPTEGPAQAAKKQSSPDEAVWAAGDCRRLAFPDRQPSDRYRRVGEGGRLWICASAGSRRQDDAVCPRQFDRDSYAGRQAGPVLHGRGVFAQGYTAGPGRGFGHTRLAARSTRS